MYDLKRYSSRRHRLDRTFLAERLKNARAYDRIAGYFHSSLLELIGDELESISGPIRVVCNSTLEPQDVQTARAAQMALWQAWAGASPETWLDRPTGGQLQGRLKKLYDFLYRGKLQVRVLPDQAFGLIHGKAGVITLHRPHGW